MNFACFSKRVQMYKLFFNYKNILNVFFEFIFDTILMN